MKKEEFIKQVTGLFATEKFDDLHELLKKHGSLTIENKKLIGTLNESIGDGSIKNTLEEITQQQRVDTRNRGKAIEAAIKAKDEKILLEILEPLTFAEQFKHVAKLRTNPDMFNSFLKNTVDNLDSLTKNEVINLKQQINSSFHLDVPEGLVSVIASNTNDVDFYINFLTQKASGLTYGQPSHIDTKQMQMYVNKLYDTLEQHKKGDKYNDPNKYFEGRYSLIPYLSKDRIERNEFLSKLNPTSIVKGLIDQHKMKVLEHFLEKQNNDIEVSFETFKAILFVHKDVSKIKLFSEAKINFSDIYSLLRHRPSMLVELIQNKDVLPAIKKQEFKLSNEELDLILLAITSKEAQLIFKDKNIFILDDNQKNTVGEFINNPDKHIIEKLCNQISFPITDVIADYVSNNLENDEFVAQLNRTAKDLIITRILDISKINNASKFIQNFLVDMEPQKFNCYHSRFLGQLSNDQQEIQRFIFTNKINFKESDYHPYEILKVGHLVSPETKIDIFKDILDSGINLDFFSRHDKNLSQQEKENLAELQKYVEDNSKNTTKKKMKR